MSMAIVLVVLLRTTTDWPLSVAALVPVRPASETTSPFAKPCAVMVRMVGLPRAIPVMVLAVPVPLPT
jgi:hypothetical protein